MGTSNLRGCRCMGRACVDERVMGRIDPYHFEFSPARDCSKPMLDLSGMIPYLAYPPGTVPSRVTEDRHEPRGAVECCLSRQWR